MKYITILQLLGKDDIIKNVLVDENGIIHGIIQKHINDNQTLEEKKQYCRDLFHYLFSRLMPLGYLPVDIVPINVINNYPIDIGLISEITFSLSNDEFKIDY